MDIRVIRKRDQPLGLIFQHPSPVTSSLSFLSFTQRERLKRTASASELIAIFYRWSCSRNRQQRRTSLKNCDRAE